MARIQFTTAVVATLTNARDGSPIIVSELRHPNGHVWYHEVEHTEKDGKVYTSSFGNDYTDGYGDAMFEAEIMAGIREDPWAEPEPMSPLEEAESGAGMEKIRDWQFHMNNPWE